MAKKRRRSTRKSSNKYLSYAFPKSYVIQLGVVVVVVGAILLAFVAGMRLR